MNAPLPVREAERLQALREYGLMDTAPEAVFDEIAALASYVFHTPIAGIGLLDERRQWFKARIGFDFNETPREAVFCAHTILEPEILVVPDALADPRFATSPYVLGEPGIRFYAGVPLTTREGHALGALCVIDTAPRECFEPTQKEALKTLGRHLMGQIEIRYSSAFLARALLERRQAEQAERARLLEHEKEMRCVNERKDRFLALLAHELRTPLGSIVNALEILRSPEPGDAAKIIETQATHLSRLIEDILDVSRITRGKITLRKIPLNLVEAVRDAALASRYAFLKNGQHFAMELPETPLWVQADPVRLAQIVSNLLANAIKFTRSGKQIRLGLWQEGTHGVLCIRDEGIGIPADMLQRIFEPFVQVDAGPDRSGLGLGLPLVRQLANLHDGSVEVRSDGPELGAEFFVRLPLLAKPPLVPLLEEARAESSHPVVRRRVLVIEDNAALGSTLGRLLSRWGHEPHLIASGGMALEQARAWRPDVALVDIGLPEKDGFAVAERLCSTPELAGLRLIAMSGYGGEEERLHAQKAGFHEFLLKPVDPLFLRRLLET